MKLDPVTGISLAVLVLVAAVVYAVLFMPGASDQLKTTVVQSVLLALAAVTGYWLGSTAAEAKRNRPPPPEPQKPPEQEAPKP